MMLYHLKRSRSTDLSKSRSCPDKMTQLSWRVICAGGVGMSLMTLAFFVPQSMIGRSAQASVTFLVQALSTVRLNARMRWSASSVFASAKYLYDSFGLSGSNVR